MYTRTIIKDMQDEINSDIKTFNCMETIKNYANPLSTHLQIKAIELNSFYICVTVFVYC